MIEVESSGPTSVEARECPDGAGRPAGIDEHQVGRDASARPPRACGARRTGPRRTRDPAPRSPAIRRWLPAPEALDDGALALADPAEIQTAPDRSRRRSRPPRPARYATRALATIVLVGVQPSLMQVPPTCSRSIRSVRRPASRQGGGQRHPGLAGADDDGIVVLGCAHRTCGVAGGPAGYGGNAGEGPEGSGGRRSQANGCRPTVPRLP